MPGESKKISELESASSLNNGDLLELASVNALSETGYSSKKTTIADVANKIATLNPQAQADWTEADDTDPSYIQNKPTLATVATSGSYNDLLDQPQIPDAQVNSDWNSVSGVSEILNKPTLGTAASKNTGVANGVAELDANGLVPTSQLPAYVDDVLEYASQSAFPATGETGKIYVALDTNLTYRWSGSAYVEISPSLALGETSSTAYAGNKGKANADAISAIQTTLSGLATVATTGNYADLTGKPNIPTVNDATVTFTQGGTTKGSITLNQAADATIALDAGGSGSGGHTILDDEGTSLTQRNDLQFKGAYSVDNSTDQITEVNVVREMTKAEFDLLTADEKVGIINVTDEGGSPDRNYSETTLWSGSESSTSSGATITLSDDITNYDDIIFVAHADNSTDGGFARFNVSLLTVGNTYVQDIYDPNLFTVFWGLDSSTQIKWYSATQQRAIIVTEIVGIKYGNGTQTFHNYSTAEQVVGTWIDGSTIYQKTYTATFSNIVKDTEYQIADISSLSIKDVLNSFGSCKYSGTGLSDNFLNLGGLMYCFAYPNGDLKFVQNMTSATSGRQYDVKVTIQYTKTTT